MAQVQTKMKIEVTGKNGDPVKELKDLKVQFNPPEYTVTKGAQVAEIGIPGLDSPILQFVGGTNEQINLKLFFDTTKKKTDVRKETERFYKLVKINSELHAPPLCRLSWGKSMGGFTTSQESKFTGIVTNITQRFTLFDSDGTPLRAELDVTFKEHKTIEQQVRELKLQSSDHTKIRKVQRGDTLSGIAATEYGNPGNWREIAQKNNISDPRVLMPGQTLKISPLE